MKSRIEKLLFQDQGRLPMLTLVPEVGQVEDLPKLRAALSARLDKAEESGEERKSSQIAVVESESREREEREMLKIALEWIALQEME